MCYKHMLFFKMRIFHNLNYSTFREGRFLVRTKGLELEVGGISGHREHTERVCVSQAALPALHGNNRGVCPYDVQLERVLEAEADAVVHLRRSVSPVESKNTLMRFGIQRREIGRIRTSVCHWWV